MTRRLTTDGQDGKVLILVSAVLLAVILITGYHALTHKPVIEDFTSKAGSYNAEDRADITSLVKAVS